MNFHVLVLWHEICCDTIEFVVKVNFISQCALDLKGHVVNKTFKVALNFVAGTAIFVSGTGAANAANLYFTFSNTVGNTNGTVIGEIEGLNPDGTSAPTDIIIDSYPSLLVQSGNYPTPVDVFAWTGAVPESDPNTFTLSGGNFVSGSFVLTNGNGDEDQIFINSNCHCVVPGADTNFFDIGSNNTRYVYNVGGVGPNGITFSSTPFSAAVPEPAAWALMLTGLGLVGGCLRKRVRIAVAC